MRKISCIAFFFLAGALCGCTSVVSVHPLYMEKEIEKPLLDPRMEGEWILSAMDAAQEGNPNRPPPCRMNIFRPSPSADEPGYSLEIDCPKSIGEAGDKSEFEVHLVPASGVTLFDARIVEFQEKGQRVNPGEMVDKGIIPAHLLGAVWIEQDFLRAATVEPDWVEKNWPENFLVMSRVADRAQVDILTNPTRDLRDRLSRHANSPEMFGFPFYLCRIGVDCDLQAFEDQLKRTPDDGGVLRSSADFYARRGDFVRAVALQRHKVEVAAQPGQDEVPLARLLLLARDFEGARHVLTSAKEPSQRPSLKDMVVLSYFLQGDYAGAVQAERSMGASANLVSADAILLAYYSMQRLGQNKEAESYLRDQASAFIGNAQEHLFLAEAAGRVTDAPTLHDQQRATFYGALKNLKDGQPQLTRSQLQQLIQTGRKDDLIVLAAKVELERLGVRPTK